MFGREPVAIATAIRLILLAAMAFGLNLTDVQLVASMAAIEAVLTLVTRSQVSPEATVNDLIKIAVNEPKGTAVATVREIQSEKDD